MYTMTHRDIAGLTHTELMASHVQRVIGEESGLVTQMAARNSRRMIRAAIDHEENNGEQQIPPDEE